MVDISIVDGVINQLTSGGCHIVWDLTGFNGTNNIIKYMVYGKYMVYTLSNNGFTHIDYSYIMLVNYSYIYKVGL